MATATFDSVAPPKLHFRENLSLWISDAKCRLVVSNPALDPTLWNEYLHGALRTYAKYGVERTLSLDTISDGAGTELFFAAVDTHGHVVGGARVTGPLWSAADSHALVEWAGSPGELAVRKMIDDRVPFGVVEVKAAWVDSDLQDSGSIATALARVALPTMTLMEVQFVMATAAAHVLDRWRSSGGVVASTIPAVAYPDERYRTKMMWWDRSTIANCAEPKQFSRMYAETGKLVRQAEALSETIAAAGVGR
jgi:hypothetical protein